MSAESIGIRLVEFIWLTKYNGDRGPRPQMTLQGITGDTPEKYTKALEDEVLRLRGVFATLTADLTDPASDEIIVSGPEYPKTVWRKA